jgi:hypothetical protein
MPSFAPVSKNFRSMLALVPLSILIAGFFVPEVGMAVPFILMVAVAGAFGATLVLFGGLSPRRAARVRDDEDFQATADSRSLPIPFPATLMVVF